MRLLLIALAALIALVYSWMDADEIVKLEQRVAWLEQRPRARSFP